MLVFVRCFSLAFETSVGEGEKTIDRGRFEIDHSRFEINVASIEKCPSPIPSKKHTGK